MRRYTLNPAMPVLLRPEGAVQVGWDPRRAVQVRPPAGLSAAALAELLRTLQSGATLADLEARFEVDAGELVASLVAAGVVRAAERRRSRCASIRIHGRGPLSDLLARRAALLGCPGDAVEHHAGGATGDDGSGGRVGFPGDRSAGGARTSHRRGGALAGAAA